jgi:alpha-beta hydrolase superfamily lysophospholipase
MAGGFAVTKEPATDRFAADFNAVGYSVLAFDYRRLGESTGQPRLVLPIRDQIADWHAAIDFARTLPGVNPDKIAIWGFSASAGHLFPVAARNHRVAAVIAQTPFTNGPALARHVLPHSTPAAQLRLNARGVLDALRGLLRLPPLLVPLTGPKGTVALLSTPDSQEGATALNAARYPSWQQAVAARSVLLVPSYRPDRHVPRIQSPLLILTCENDQSTANEVSIRTAHRAPRGEHAQTPGGHYAPFTTAHGQAVQIQLAFLGQHLGLTPDSQAPRAGQTY